jgi:hypothetical protein
VPFSGIGQCELLYDEHDGIQTVATYDRVRFKHDLELSKMLPTSLDLLGHYRKFLHQLLAFGSHQVWPVGSTISCFVSVRLLYVVCYVGRRTARARKRLEGDWRK